MYYDVEGEIEVSSAKYYKSQLKPSGSRTLDTMSTVITKREEEGRTVVQDRAIGEYRAVV